MWSSIISVFREYMGTGLVMIWYLLCLVWLLFREEDRTKRCLLIYTPLMILLIFFNPLSMALMEGLADGEIYYRILWLLPVSVTVLYALIRMGEQLSPRMRGCLFGGALALAVLTGKLIYLNGAFCWAENAYHVPDSVVHICDELVVPGRDVQAVFPDELVGYVRQYSPYVCMPYGRNLTVERWYGQTDLHLVMIADEIDPDRLGVLAAAEGCHYIVLDEERAPEGEIPGFEYFELIDGYVIYRSLTADFTA